MSIVQSCLFCFIIIAVVSLISVIYASSPRPLPKGLGKMKGEMSSSIFCCRSPFTCFLAVIAFIYMDLDLRACLFKLKKRLTVV